MVDIRKGLTDAVRATLEEMFFLEVAEPVFKWARVEIMEPFTGAVTLAFPLPLVEDVASGLMPGQAIPEQMLDDTLAEMVNTVAGRLMSVAVDENTTFRLDVPRTGTGWPAAKRQPMAIVPYQIDRKCFIVMLEGRQLAALDDAH